MPIRFCGAFVLALALAASTAHADPCADAIKAANASIANAAKHIEDAPDFPSEQEACDEYTQEAKDDERTLELSRVARRVCGARYVVQCDEACKAKNLAKLNKRVDETCRKAHP